MSRVQFRIPTGVDVLLSLKYCCETDRKFFPGLLVMVYKNMAGAFPLFIFNRYHNTIKVRQ
jgi:hypothetical protein